MWTKTNPKLQLDFRVFPGLLHELWEKYEYRSFSGTTWRDEMVKAGVYSKQ